MGNKKNEWKRVTIGGVTGIMAGVAANYAVDGLAAVRCPLSDKQRQLVSLSAAHADNHSADTQNIFASLGRICSVLCVLCVENKGGKL